MSGETTFLIALLRCFLNPESRLPDPKKIDWTALLNLAAAHAVTPILYTVLQGTSIPNWAAEELHSGFERSVVASLAQSGELARVAGLSEEHGIPVVALKGPLL